MSITVKCNLQVKVKHFNATFLDVAFDLRTDIYYPYRKENNQICYINKPSN